MFDIDGIISLVMIETGAQVDLSSVAPSFREKQSFNERAIRGLSLRGGSSEDITRIMSTSISSPLETTRLTDEEREIVLAKKFLSFFSDDLTDWNSMLSIVGDNSSQRSFPALLCLEAFLKARARGHVEFYFIRFKKVFEKCPSPLANDHRAIRDAFSPKYFVDTNMPETELSADIHRFRRRKSQKKDTFEEPLLDVAESAFFE